MKILWKYLINISLCLFAITPAFAQTPDELAGLSNQRLINSLDLGKHAKAISEFQYNEAKRLLKNTYAKDTGCTIETTRNGEVLIITIPADKLFLPNDEELMSDCNRWLDPIKRYLKKPDMYRVLLVMHTDNTGSEAYNDNLSLKRVEAVWDWFDAEGVDISYLFPTAAGSSSPLPKVPNDTMENRARNRRLEIYLIPGKTMLDQANHGRIAL